MARTYIHERENNCFLMTDVVQNNLSVQHSDSVTLFLVFPVGWSTELDDVEIYKCSQEVQESNGRN